MILEINETNPYHYITKRLCRKHDENLHYIAPELGEGTLHYEELGNGLAMYHYQMILSEPILVQWNMDTKMDMEFFMIFNYSSLNEKDNSQLKEKTIEEGLILISSHNPRRRLWLPNIAYDFIVVRFNGEWLRAAQNHHNFPKSFIDFIEATDNLEHSIPSNNLIRGPLNALRFTTNIEPQELKRSYQSIKASELIFLLIYRIYNSISVKKTHDAIHPDDMLNINNFIGGLNKRMDRLPSIKEASEELKMSMSKFQRLFKKVEHRTYYDFILQLRMTYALNLLMMKNTASETAFKTGYSTLGNFSYAFKKYFNFLPSEV